MMKKQIRQLMTVACVTSALGLGISTVGTEAASALSVNRSHDETKETLNANSEQLLANRRGRASWYGRRFHGRRTASGETFNAYSHTAAHRSLPFGTRVRVTNLNNGRSVVVRINDRGPYSGGRIIDLSRAAAEAIGMLRTGTAPVRVEVLGR